MVHLLSPVTNWVSGTCLKAQISTTSLTRTPVWSRHSHSTRTCWTTGRTYSDLHMKTWKSTIDNPWQYDHLMWHL